MDRKKLQALRDKVAAIVLPLVKKNQYPGTNQEAQKELSAVATAGAALLGKAKLVRGAKYQEKLVKLAEKLKTSGGPFGQSALLPTTGLRTARTTLLNLLKAIDAESRDIFIVHGHDLPMRDEVQATLHRFGIDGIILSEEMNKGQTIIEKFDRVARECGYAVVLFSPDDVGGPKKVGKAEQKLSARARQNVVLELGFFVGILGREKVFVLVAGSGLEQPSDFHGVVYEPYDKTGGWKRRLANELTGVGFYIDPGVLKKM